MMLAVLFKSAAAATAAATTATTTTTHRFMTGRNADTPCLTSQ
jgi:hypothetical protein